MLKITILGSTGSIGRQTLEVIDGLKNIEVESLTTNVNIEIMFNQIKKYKPSIVCVVNEKKGEELKTELKEKGIDVEVIVGVNGLVKVATLDKITLVVNAVVGNVGLIPTLEGIRNKKNIALANKETLVTAGKIVMEEAKKNKVSIMPIDSEHCAIYQCLEGNKKREVEKIILTASGGAFRDKTIKELEDVTLDEALTHPNWSMGKKITIDSATLVNKGLEVIEAKWLFDIDFKNIEVVIHRQSIIHSMVEYVDGSIIAQLGTSDMRTPIQYCLTYPKRVKNKFKKFNFWENGELTFSKPDTIKFPGLKYAFDALEEGGLMPTVYNSANEKAVELFLSNEIKFLDIYIIILDAMKTYKVRNIQDYKLEDIIEIDNSVKKYVENKWRKK